MNSTYIIQYNCGHTNAQSSRPFFDSLTQLMVIAIQEPGYNRWTRSTYYLKLYELTYEALLKTRVCFMINRQVGAAHWRRTQYGPNVASLTLDTTLGKITIVNVYNPRDTGPRVRE
jgi:hypothetical protein